MVLAFTAGVFPPLLLVPLELPQPARLVNPITPAITAAIRVVLFEKNIVIFCYPVNPRIGDRNSQLTL
jgi:hypothetical protein